MKDMSKTRVITGHVNSKNVPADVTPITASHTVSPIHSEQPELTAQGHIWVIVRSILPKRETLSIRNENPRSSGLLLS